MTTQNLTPADYTLLADFRYALRHFTTFSETAAGESGLTPQQHQALLAIKGAQGDEATIGYLAERLALRPHSASGLVTRLEAVELLARRTASDDRRRAQLYLTPRAEAILADLSATHLEELRRLRPMLMDLLDRIGTETDPTHRT